MPLHSFLRVIAGLLALVAASPAWSQERPLLLDSDGVQIHYVDEGRGEPVVLLHGFTGSAQRHWGRPGVIDALQTAGYRVLAMDCRGHGQSDKPEDPAAYGLQMVADVIRLLDHLDVDRAHVVGYSMGRAIVNQLTVHHAGRVGTATLVGAGYDDPDEVSTLFLALADGFEREDASALIRGVTSSGGDGPTEDEISAMSASLFERNPPRVLTAVARGLPALYELPVDQLRSVTRPMLAITGEHDTQNIPAVRRMAEVVASLEVVVLPGASHATSVRSSAAPLVEFLRRHPIR